MPSKYGSSFCCDVMKTAFLKLQSAFVTLPVKVCPERVTSFDSSFCKILSNFSGQVDDGLTQCLFYSVVMVRKFGTFTNCKALLWTSKRCAYLRFNRHKDNLGQNQFIVILPQEIQQRGVTQQTDCLLGLSSGFIYGTQIT